MKKVRFFCFFFFLAVFSSPCYSAGKQSSSCGELFEEGESFEDSMPLKDFVQLMADLKIYSTRDLAKAKREGDFPEEAPEKPLRTYFELKGQWSVLWDKVHSIRLSQGEDVAERRKLTESEFLAFMREVSNKESDGRETLEGDFFGEREEMLEADPSIEQEDGDVNHSKYGKSGNIQVDGLKHVQQGKNGGKALSNLWKKEPADQTAHNERFSVSLSGKSEALSLMAKNPRMRRGELAEKMKISMRQINAIISELKREGRLSRLGGTNRHGYWHLPEKEDKTLLR
ncbi:MAG: hypothetical protein OXJ52_08030 [Oligoflexia bacterium]|nr:hypothetical protein [Oligoflexia bacterium]